MKTKGAVPLAMAAGISWAAVAGAATLTTEPFAASLDGWTNGYSKLWIATSQFARVSFASSELPQSASLEAGAGASGGAFNGDFTAAGAEAIGFSFFAENSLPSSLQLQLTGGTNVFFQELSPRMTATGTWNYFLVSLAPRDAARWGGAPAANFPSAMTNINHVTLYVAVGVSTNTAALRVDDIFLDRLPVIVAIAPGGTNTQLAFDNLRTNFTYGIQTVGDLTNAWTAPVQFIATNRTDTKTVTNAASPVFFRLKN